VRPGRDSSQHLISINIIGNPTSTGQYHIVTHGNMPGNSGLTGKSSMLADNGTSGHTNLGSNGCIFTNLYIMGNLHKVIYLCPTSYSGNT
jgi:hypothetical protein